MKLIIALAVLTLSACAQAQHRDDYGAAQTFVIVDDDPNAPPVPVEKPCTMHCRVPTDRDLQTLEEVRIDRRVSRIIEENRLAPRAFKRPPHWK